jgi:AcrR family transcriptional regulator
MAHVPVDQRRKEFVDAAVRVIARHGMSDATTRRIAEAADAPAAALHYCFRSKDELFVAVLEAEATMLVDQVGPATSGSGLGLAAARVLRDVIAWLSINRDRALAAFDLELWALRQERSLAARGYEMHIEPLMSYLLLSCGPGDDPTVVPWVSRMINCLADGLMLQWFSFDDDEQLARDTEAACEMLAHQIAYTSSVSNKRPR